MPKENIEEVEELDPHFVQMIVDQIEKEYQYCYKTSLPKIEEWYTRLKLYNNQRRLKDKVGDPLLFTVFQTILASLYDDGLKVEFRPREEGDIDQAENANLLAEYDNAEMKKDELDYEWDFEAMFFGRGVVCTMEFDYDRMCPAPEVWSRLTLLRDPDATSVNGNLKGQGACRFLGRETYQLQWKLKDHPAYFNLDKIEEGQKTADNLQEKSDDARAEAMGMEKIIDTDIGDNQYMRTLQWFTFLDGKRYFVELANNRKTIIRLQELPDQDEFPLVDRAIFPLLNTFDGVSIPDLIEDKQRARAVLLNAGLESAKANANPMYFFDSQRIKRRDQLNYEFNKFVPVDGPPRDAVVPMTKDQIKSESQYIFQVLDESVQRALATPELQQGATPRKARTLGELELMSAKVDTRYSLAAKIFGWSEKRFWKNWYKLYKEYFPGAIKEKTVRLQGVFGPEFKTFTKDDFVSKIDPDIIVESEAIARAQKAVDRNILGEFLGFGSQLPGFNIRYAIQEMGRMSGFSKGKIDQLMPPTYDEMSAETENQMMNEGNKPRVLLTDQHLNHIAIHSKSKNEALRDEHIATHRMAIRIIHEYPEMFDPNLIGEGGAQPVGAPGAPPPTGEEQMAPGNQGGGRGANIPQSYQQGMPQGGQEQL